VPAGLCRHAGPRGSRDGRAQVKKKDIGMARLVESLCVRCLSIFPILPGLIPWTARLVSISDAFPVNLLPPTSPSAFLPGRQQGVNLSDEFLMDACGGQAKWH
jgi:hypothetical protein